MSSDRAATQKTDARTEPYTYMSVGDDVDHNGSRTSVVEWAGASGVSNRALEQREKQGYERGLQDGEARARKIFEQGLADARASVAKTLAEFRSQREMYFGSIEPEVVQLALSIARKILHREAQMDPLLLTGMVHVALEKLDEGTRVRLRAHPDEIHFWNRHFSESGALRVLPEIIGDPSLRRGECALETEIGHTQISLDTQLKEIEQGFFDLLEQRPLVR